MNRREFLKKSFLGAVTGLAATNFLVGCMSRVGNKAGDKKAGTPYRCAFCGYLTRSTKDLTRGRCPRCLTNQFKEISETEMTKYLAEEKE
jgi:phage FluMu protein Com